ncbi:hypothetical protein Tco_0710144 [Tanacetum coccineum]
METKDTLSSCSNLEEQQMQQIQDIAKKSCMVSLRLLHSHLKLLLNNNLKRTQTEDGFKRAFETLLRQDVKIFTCTMFLNVDQLEKQLDKEEFQETGSMAAFRVLETQFQKFIKPWISLNDEDGIMAHKRISGNGKLGAKPVDDADIRPIYDEELMAKVQSTENNVFATRQQHTEQPKFNNEGEVDQNAEQCHDKRHLPTKLTDNQIMKLSYESLESEHIWQNMVNFWKVKVYEAKVKHDIDVIETINIELEHKVAKLLKENETLKKHYKELYDSIKTTRAKTIENTTSLIAQNAEFKAQL